jgi:hypothetical protein
MQALAERLTSRPASKPAAGKNSWTQACSSVLSPGWMARSTKARPPNFVLKHRNILSVFFTAGLEQITAIHLTR